MKKVSGYLGLDGEFYKTERECYKADLEFKIEDVRYKLDRFQDHLQRSLFKYMSDRRSNHFSERDALRLVSELVLKDSDMFLELIKQKKELAEHLDALVAEKMYLDKWWVKFKWW